jgi:hypothetical protein
MNNAKEIQNFKERKLKKKTFYSRSISLISVGKNESWKISAIIQIF